MSRPCVFIDGHVGTTGLRIHQWLAGREDLELAALPQARRKDPAARREALNQADLAVLCLPDAESRQAVAWIENPATRVIDSSTAYRTAPDWVYGLPELEPGQRSRIAETTRVSNPGCYATAVILALRPLVDAGILAPDAPLAVHALSGYSGGGQSLIERWEDPVRGLLAHLYPAPYSLERVHKHIPEIQHYGGLAHEPQFIPAVGPFRSGMRVEIPLHSGLLRAGSGAASPKAIHELLAARYAGEPFVGVAEYREPFESDEYAFDPLAHNGTNRLEIVVVPHPSGHALLMVILDNLGKGACGVAIQNLNLMLGLTEEMGLPT